MRPGDRGRAGTGSEDRQGREARMANALTALQDYGQSVWLDYIRRSLLTSGELKRLIEEDGLRGVTSNPAIFEKAITGSTDYEAQLAQLATADLPVPGQSYTFGVVKAAQARGDFAVLTERRRRALRVHLGADVAAGLQALERAVADAVA